MSMIQRMLQASFCHINDQPPGSPE